MTKTLTKPPPLQNHEAKFPKWTPPTDDEHWAGKLIVYEESDEPWAAYCDLGHYNMIPAPLFDVRTDKGQLLGFATMDPSILDDIKIPVALQDNFARATIPIYGGKGKYIGDGVDDSGQIVPRFSEAKEIIGYKKPDYQEVKAGVVYYGSEKFSCWVVKDLFQMKSIAKAAKGFIISIEDSVQWAIDNLYESVPSHRLGECTQKGKKHGSLSQRYTEASPDRRQGVRQS